MTNQELILHIAEDMELLSHSIRRFADNMLSSTDEEPQKPVTLEEVRNVLSAKLAAGKNAEVKSLITKYGVNSLSAIDPVHYAEIMKEAEVL